jgi:D-3-phosphoglycerate dehydrogenase / 2-oxoglutarate reductase
VAERFRVLVSCPRAWDGLDEFADLFEQHGIDVDVPDVVRQQLTEPELLAVIDRYDGILAGDDHLTRKVIEAGSRLKVISKWGVGIDAIDTTAAAENGVVVTNTPGVFGDELADYALGFILMIARRQHAVDREVRDGGWPSIRGHSLAGRTLGIVGLGSSGTALAERGHAMKMKVVGVDPFRTDPGSTALVRLVEMGELLGTVRHRLPPSPRPAGRGGDHRRGCDRIRQTRLLADQHIERLARRRGGAARRFGVGPGGRSCPRCVPD